MMTKLLYSIHESVIFYYGFVLLCFLILTCNVWCGVKKGCLLLVHTVGFLKENKFAGPN